MSSAPKQSADRHPRVLIRVDSSTRIGTGHMVRCLTLAEQLRAKKCDVCFVARAHPGNINSAVAEKGFSLTELPAPPHTGAPIEDADYPAWLGVTQDQDAQETLAAVVSKHFDWLVVDHYSLDARWEGQMRPVAQKIMAIDDLANRPHDCDVLLDQNLHSDASTRYESLIPPTASRFIGPEFALLRPEFYQPIKASHGKPRRVENVLISMGGSDPQNITNFVMATLRKLRYSRLCVSVVIGAANHHRFPAVSTLDIASQFKFYRDTKKMAKLMDACDVVICGGGVTLLETIARRKPSLAIAVAENQVEGINSVHRLFRDQSRCIHRQCRTKYAFLENLRVDINLPNSQLIPVCSFRVPSTLPLQERSVLQVILKDLFKAR